jgi:hypothetical protein
LKRETRKNKIMLEVLNVEMPWQRAIRWKGMHVKKEQEIKKELTNRRAKKCQKKRWRGWRFFLSSNIRHSAILFTDKRT